MNINELRINNLISHRGLICTVEIINGELDEIYFLGEDFYHWDKPENLEGVPLTEEWLLKFGFEKKSGWDDYEYYIKDEVEIIFNENVMFKNSIENQIEYVHQIQNIYFALTNEELTLNK